MFKSFQDCLDAELKRLTSCGVRATVKEVESLSEELGPMSHLAKRTTCKD